MILPMVHLLKPQYYIFCSCETMGKAKTAKKFNRVKKVISPKDERLLKTSEKQSLRQKKAEENEKKTGPRELPKESTSLFFSHNTNLGPPYHILVDTNFINFSIQHKLDLFKAMMDCLLAKCTFLSSESEWFKRLWLRSLRVWTLPDHASIVGVCDCICSRYV
eukprot:GHVU01091577.1.p1 GENE.GHVU01091577.1~~GHVU01091577.1.p1  ORF type:complete len:163 (+),score=17.78 GHVU01091577.1:224-712(+)